MSHTEVIESHWVTPLHWSRAGGAIEVALGLSVSLFPYPHSRSLANTRPDQNRTKAKPEQDQHVAACNLRPSKRVQFAARKGVNL